MKEINFNTKMGHSDCLMFIDTETGKQVCSIMEDRSASAPPTRKRILVRSYLEEPSRSVHIETVNLKEGQKLEDVILAIAFHNGTIHLQLEDARGRFTRSKFVGGDSIEYTPDEYKAIKEYPKAYEDRGEKRHLYESFIKDHLIKSVIDEMKVPDETGQLPPCVSIAAGNTVVFAQRVHEADGGGIHIVVSENPREIYVDNKKK